MCFVTVIIYNIFIYYEDKIFTFSLKCILLYCISYNIMSSHAMSTDGYIIK